MSFALVAHTGAVHTTSALNTTGANLIVVVAAYDSAATLSDSLGNTWNGLTAYSHGSDNYTKIWYCYAPTVGSAQTFTLSISYGYLAVAAFSGATTTPFDIENGAYTTGGVSLQTGSITPSIDNELIISGLCFGGNSSAPSVDSGMTITDSTTASQNVSYGGALAYKIQTTAAAINPTWSWTTSEANSVAIASFKSSSSTPVLSSPGMYLLNSTGGYPRVTRA